MKKLLILLGITPIIASAEVSSVGEIRVNIDNNKSSKNNTESKKIVYPDYNWPKVINEKFPPSDYRKESLVRSGASYLELPPNFNDKNATYWLIRFHISGAFIQRYIAELAVDFNQNSINSIFFGDGTPSEFWSMDGSHHPVDTALKVSTGLNNIYHNKPNLQKEFKKNLLLFMSLNANEINLACRNAYNTKNTKQEARYTKNVIIKFKVVAKTAEVIKADSVAVVDQTNYLRTSDLQKESDKWRKPINRVEGNNQWPGNEMVININAKDTAYIASNPPSVDPDFFSNWLAYPTFPHAFVYAHDIRKKINALGYHFPGWKGRWDGIYMLDSAMLYYEQKIWKVIDENQSNGITLKIVRGEHGWMTIEPYMQLRACYTRRLFCKEGNRSEVERWGTLNNPTIYHLYFSIWDLYNLYASIQRLGPPRWSNAGCGLCTWIAKDWSHGEEFMSKTLLNYDFAHFINIVMNTMDADQVKRNYKPDGTLCKYIEYALAARAAIFIVYKASHLPSHNTFSLFVEPQNEYVEWQEK